MFACTFQAGCSEAAGRLLKCNKGPKPQVFGELQTTVTLNRLRRYNESLREEVVEALTVLRSLQIKEAHAAGEESPLRGRPKFRPPVFRKSASREHEVSGSLDPQSAALVLHSTEGRSDFSSP